MRTRRWAPLAVAPLLALTSVAWLSAQEEQEKRPEHQAHTQETEHGQAGEITVRLEAVENSGVNGTAVVRFAKKSEERQQEGRETRPEQVEIRYDLSGLQADGSYQAVIHQGACATSTTLVATLGGVTADENGRFQRTVEVEDQRAIAALTSARDLTAVSARQRTAERQREETQEREAERQQMANESQKVRHLQLQQNGQPVACGNFEASSGS